MAISEWSYRYRPVEEGYLAGRLAEGAAEAEVMADLRRTQLE